MEITLVNVSAPHGSEHATTCIAVTAGAKTLLLTGVNLLRPLGVPLAGLPLGCDVENMGSVDLGKMAAHDGNLAVPGQAVTPIVTIAPPANFNMGTNFVRLKVQGGNLSVEPISPSPNTVPHIPMDTSVATAVQNWTLSDGNNLMATLPAFQQAVGLNLTHVHEGTMALFTDRAGIDAIGLVVDVNTTAGGGATVTAVMLSQVINRPEVQALLA